MKKKIAVLSFFSILTLSLNVANADPVPVKESTDPQFELHKKAVIMEALNSKGLYYDEKSSLNTILGDLKSKVQKGVAKNDIIQEVEQLENADYVFLSDTGDVYSSKRGYLGKGEKIDTEENNYGINSSKNNSSDIINSDNSDLVITPMSQTNPTVDEIDGGNTGAFMRRQLNFSGFSGITSNVTLPTVSSLGTGEQPWVYYGFDSSTGGIEGGYAYQSGAGNWLPFIRNPASGYLYADNAYRKNSGDTINNLKFYVKKQSGQTYYTAYLVIVGSTTTQVKYASTPWTSTSGLSVKYCDSIAKNGFTGTNITGKTYNQRFDNVQVSNNDGASYTSFSSYSTYKEWKKAPNGDYKWYGTIDCLPNYIHNSSGSVSIYQ